MADYLLKKGLDGQILLYITPYDYIYSDSYGGVISQNGKHFGVLFNGIVYCNVHPAGLPYEAWEADFHVPGEDHVIVPFPLTWRNFTYITYRSALDILRRR